MKLPSLSNDVSDVMLQLRKVSDFFVSTASARSLSTADRTALRALLDELEALADDLDQLRAD